MTNKTLTGQCLCGAIRYEVDKIEPRMGHCHCSMCRKFSGSAFATFGEATTDNFRWTRGESLLQAYTADNGTVRRFCQQCGSSLTFTPSNGGEGLIEFTLGTLDSDIDQRPDAHIYTAFKANWVQIDDDLPAFQRGRTN